MNTPTHRTILDGVRRLRSRWIQTRSVRFTLQALFYLLLAGALALLAFPEMSKGVLAIALLGGAALCGGLAAWLGSPSEATLAKDYDDAAGLKDRLSSSIELMEKQDDPMVAALIEDAAVSTARVTPKEVYAYSLPKEGRWIPVPALLLVGVLFLNNFGDANQGRDPKLDEKLEATTSVLEEIISEQKNQELTERQKEILEELEQLKAKLSEPQMDKKEAMAEVAELLDQLEREEDARKEREQKLREMLEGLKEENEDLADEMEEGNWEEALNKLKKQMEELKKKLEKKKKEGASPEEIAALEQKLKEMKEIEAKLVEMLNIRNDGKMLAMTLDFLEFVEGDLGEIGDGEPPEFLKPCDCKDHGT